MQYSLLRPYSLRKTKSQFDSPNREISRAASSTEISIFPLDRQPNHTGSRVIQHTFPQHLFTKVLVPPQYIAYFIITVYFGERVSLQEYLKPCCARSHLLILV